MSRRNTKITQAEMAELFGERIPVAAAMLLFSDKPTDEIRAELREMALERRAMTTSARDVIASGFDSPHADKYADAILESLASAGFRIIAPGQLDQETVERCAKYAQSAWIGLAGSDVQHHERKAHGERIAAGLSALTVKQEAGR